MKKEEKQRLIEILGKELESATGIYFLDFTGLSAQDMRSLRTAMRKGNIKIRVVKNIVAKFALEKLKLNNLLCFLDGPTAISYVYENPILPSKVINDFSKEKEIRVKGGFIEGSLISSEEIKELALLPNREVLLQKLLFSLSNSLYTLLNTLRSPLQGFVGVLDQISKRS
ncbi:50S ribosomal protein L10 [candidate division WOR-3 bacterium JGI_Cruoil_03_44_89]|uniref:Large ribosomal subunit protein uL10 n=1 Tax=candidate division WOR-3 bacterium JGI_Cruoil_03_44_89 TaxID=1973748 RepID=A0A235BQI5_UNCW3|nr:MAG: 50S ribosomal protein L10 [candidate division WOR-3 bacterium JGI_Cruoil_03_44_89]